MEGSWGTVGVGVGAMGVDAVMVAVGAVGVQVASWNRRDQEQRDKRELRAPAIGVPLR